MARSTQFRQGLPVGPKSQRREQDFFQSFVPPSPGLQDFQENVGGTGGRATITGLPQAASGPSPEAGFLAAILPGLAGIVPGRFGDVATSLASGLSGWIGQQSTQAAIEKQNANRALAIALANKNKPYIRQTGLTGLEKHGLRLAGEAPFHTAASVGERLRKQAAMSTQEAMAQQAGPQGVAMSPRGRRQALEEKGRMDAANIGLTTGGIFDQWRREFSNLITSMGGGLRQQEQGRLAQNAAFEQARVNLLTQLLVTPMDTASINGLIDRVRDDAQFSEQIRVQEASIAQQEAASKRAFTGGLIGAGTKALGGAAAAGIAAQGLTEAAGAAATTATTIPTIPTFPAGAYPA